MPPQQQQQQHGRRRARPAAAAAAAEPPPAAPAVAAPPAAPAVIAAAAPSNKLASEDDDAPLCRLCWGEEGASDAAGADDDPLLSPCACAGSLRWIHRSCLLNWQRTLRLQGQGRRAHICELCKTPYDLAGLGDSAGQQLQPHGARRRLPARLLHSLHAGVFDAVHNTPWHTLAVQLWHGYVMSHGALQALRLGVSGMTAGLSLGRTLVEEQAILLNGLLTWTSGLLGSPYAEMLWCQAVGALFVGMLSELVYTSILGMLAGAAYGFCSGYCAAIKASVGALTGGSVRAAAVVACVAGRLLRRATRLVLRVRV